MQGTEQLFNKIIHMTTILRGGFDTATLAVYVDMIEQSAKNSMATSIAIRMGSGASLPLVVIRREISQTKF